MLSAGEILSLFVAISFCRAEVCENLLYERDIPLTFDVRTLETITTTPGSLMGACSEKCLLDPDCVAVEVCESGGSEYCRLVQGWGPGYYPPDNGQSCQQYQMVVNTTCSPAEYYDRVSGQCVMQDLCDFESVDEPSCFLTEGTDDVFDWTRYSGSTGSVNTGPTGARAGTYYKYIETSSPRLTGDNATLVSNKVFEDKTYCLSLYYHMYGSTTGTLTIQTQTGSDDPVTLWELSGDQGNTWHSIDKLNVSLTSNTQILIHGIRGTNYYSDISIDYVVLWPFACP